METTSASFDRALIAPCGINCGTCLGYLRVKNRCIGCWPNTGFKVPHCSLCKIKNCEHLNLTESKFCYECEKFPCPRLKHIDKRYRTKYHVSLIDNLMDIKEIGIDAYLMKETGRWTCPNCGATICVHRETCIKCGVDLNKQPYIQK